MIRDKTLDVAEAGGQRLPMRAPAMQRSMSVNEYRLNNRIVARNFSLFEQSEERLR